MKRTITMITAAMFATAMALPAFAQVGAGIAGNGTVGMQNNNIGANPDVQNSDAERTEPTVPPAARMKQDSLHPLSKTVQSESNSGVGVNAGVNPSTGSIGANADANSYQTDNSPTGGY